jgi:hypothetical protein
MVLLAGKKSTFSRLLYQIDTAGVVREEARRTPRTYGMKVNLV